METLKALRFNATETRSADEDQLIQAKGPQQAVNLDRRTFGYPDTFSFWIVIQTKRLEDFFATV